MRISVLVMTVRFLFPVMGIYQTGHFTFKGNVPFSNRPPALKETLIGTNTLSYCAVQCKMERQCQAIEICPHHEQYLCRLCNFTNSVFSENGTNVCRYLQLDYKLGEEDESYTSSTHNTCNIILTKTNRRTSGLYSISIGGTPTSVWCDMETDGGGWTVIQRRQNGNTDFYRSWEDYKLGFGNASDEYWIGNDALHLMTTGRNVTLRVDLEQFSGTKGYGTYRTFKVANETNKYKLSISGYNGTITDCFVSNDGILFSTKDNDNDEYEGSCAKDHHGAWWYWACTYANFNGQYYTFDYMHKYTIFCEQWLSGTVALKKTTMMIR